MQNRNGSILAADFGSIHTRLVLLDTVDGGYRLVARVEGRTTGDFPFNDITTGLIRAVSELEQIAGRSLLDAQRQIISPEQPGGAGVDDFVATASIGRPLRTVVVGLMPDISIASALRATAGSYIEVVETLSLDDPRTEEEQVNAVIASQPDLVLISGGMDGGAVEPVQRQARIIELALRLVELPRRPVILYAGNTRLVEQMEDLFAPLTSFFAAANVRPSLERENLDDTQLQLGRAFDRFKENRGGGFEVVGAMASGDVLPTAQSYNLITEYLGKASGQSVLAVDVGSAVSTLSYYLHDDVHTDIRTDIGLGHSAYNLLEVAGVAAVQGWLPFYASAEDIATYARNKTLRPATIPQNLQDLFLEHALLRAGLRALVHTAQPRWYRNVGVARDVALPPFATIIAAGAGLTAAGNPGFAALLLLDAFQPQGITTLRMDPYALIPALGALAYVRPAAVVQALEQGGLEEIGTCISLGGVPRADRPAMKIKLTLASGETIRQDVTGGHLWVYPLPVGETAQLEVTAVGRGTHIGGRRRVRQSVTGAGLGLIFDTRGRPMIPHKDISTRAVQMPLWLAEITGLPVQPIDPRLLEPGKDDTPKPEPPKPSRRQRRQAKEAPPADEPAPSDEAEMMDDLRNALR